MITGTLFLMQLLTPLLEGLMLIGTANQECIVTEKVAAPGTVKWGNGEYRLPEAESVLLPSGKNKISSGTPKWLYLYSALSL